MNIKYNLFEEMRKNLIGHYEAVAALNADKRIFMNEVAEGVWAPIDAEEKASELEGKRKFLDEAVKTVLSGCKADMTEAIHACMKPKPDELTDDEKILNSGIALTETELVEMFGKYAAENNFTMQRLILDTARRLNQGDKMPVMLGEADYMKDLDVAFLWFDRVADSADTDIYFEHLSDEKKWLELFPDNYVMKLIEAA